LVDREDLHGAFERATLFANSGGLIRMISTKLRCIFVHIPKTAGQSIEDCFLRYHKIGWEASGFLLLRPNECPTKGPPRLAHLTAQEYVQYNYVSQQEFEQYFKFAVIRDPWTRLLSEFRSAYQLQYSFRDWLLRHFPVAEWNDAYRHVMPQSDYLFDEQGKLLVNLLVRFEHLAEDFAKVSSALGVELPSLTRKNRWQKRSWNSSTNMGETLRWLLRILPSMITSKDGLEAYDEEMKQFVRDYYRRDFELLGYSSGVSTILG
jgi:Sulfotransferase family